MTESISRWRRVAPWLLATLGYVAFTVAQTWPLVTRLTDVLPHDLGDPALNTWIVWWNAHTVPFTAKWWNAPAFWPSSGALAFSETLLGLSPLTTPIQWLGWSPVTAYNVAFLVTFPLSAIAAHALVWRLTGRHDAGAIAGLIYGFHPFRVAHFPQIQVMTSQWMPLALLGLHAYMGNRKTRWLVVFAFAWLMQGLSNGYYLLFFPVLVGIWMLWFAASRTNWRAFATIAAAFIVGSLPLVPLLWGYRRIHSAFNFQRVVGEVGTFGADVTSLLDAAPQLKFWHLEAFHQPEGELFPGLTASVLVLLLALHWLWTSDSVKRPPRAVLWLLLGSLVFIGVAISAVVVGPWTVQFGGRMLLSVRVISKPLSIGTALFACALAFVPRFRAAWRRRSSLMFYVFATGLMYLLCFGPQPHFLGVPFMYRGPYSLLMALPGYDAIRVPGRFAMLAALCLAVVAAMSFDRLTARSGRILRSVFALVIVCGVIVDSAIGEMPLKELPPRLFTAESLPAGTAVMELPLGFIGDDVLAMYRGIFHRHPVINGYSGFFPRSYDILRGGLDVRDPQVFDAVTAWGPIAVMVDKARDPEGVWERQLEQRPKTTFLGEQSGWRLYSLGAGVAPPDIDAAKRLRVESVSANVRGELAHLAIDGNTETRWDSGAQQGTEVVTVDLGSERSVDAITMTIGTHPLDFPRSLAIDTSHDGSEWTTQRMGTSVEAGFTGGVRDPREMPLLYGLPHVRARWIRLRQLGHDPVFYWSIFELHVYGE